MDWVDTDETLELDMDSFKHLNELLLLNLRNLCQTLGFAITIKTFLPSHISLFCIQELNLCVN